MKSKLVIAFVLGFVIGPIAVVYGYGSYTAYKIRKQEESVIISGEQNKIRSQMQRSAREAEYQEERKKYMEQHNIAPTIQAPQSPVIPQDPKPSGQ